MVRARPHHPEEGDWRARVVMLAERGARAIERGALAALTDMRDERELVIFVPDDSGSAGRRAAGAVLRELAR